MKELREFIIQDVDFKHAYEKYNTIDKTFIETIIELIDHIEDFEELFILDKKYLDVAYVIIEDLIYDLDGIYDSYVSQIKGE